MSEQAWVNQARKRFAALKTMEDYLAVERKLGLSDRPKE